ncbi:adenylate cyclase [Rhizobiales bacterium GAS188]|nr:adenylate cyclase [Rhizobiales bacterium GAS188]
MLLIATSAVLIGLNFYQGRRVALASASQEMRIFSERIVDRYRIVFGSAALAVEVASSSEVVRRPETEDQATLGRFLQRLLRSSEYIDGAYVGYPTGAFVHVVNVKKNPLWRAALLGPDDAAFATRIIAIDDQGRRTSRWEFIDADGRWLASTDPQPANYDPRTRPWYLSAVQQASLVSTAPYHMATTDELGITLARRHSAYGTIVMGADVLLGTIDAFLSTQLITPSSRVFVFDASSRLIARSDQISAIEAQCTENCPPFQSESGRLIDRARAVIAGIERGGSGTWTLPVNGRDYLLVILSISSTPLLEGGHIASIAPVSDLTAASERLLEQGLMLSAVVLAIGVLCAFLVASRMSRSLGAITAQAHGLRRFELGATERVRSRIAEISQLGAAVSAARETISTFGLYVPKELVRRIIGSREFTGRTGKRQNVTALFSDIMDFTTVCERHSAEDVVSMLSDYFDLFSEIVQRRRGVIIQFSGDAVFALWNAPQPDDLHIDRACLCALELKARIDDFNANQRRRGAPEFGTRFGIHTGAVVVGSVGAKDRFQYTAMGDAVNVASRLEGLNKEFKTTILVSAAVAGGARSSFRFRPLGAVHVKGREEEVDAFELCDARENEGFAGVGRIVEQLS